MNIPNAKFSAEARLKFLEVGMSPEDIDSMERVFNMPVVIVAMRMERLATAARSTFKGFVIGVVVTGAVALAASSL